MVSAQMEEEEREKIPVFETYLRKGMIPKVLELDFLV
jgi:hypothetical protein